MAEPGDILTVTSNGSWTPVPTGFTYQWQRDGVNIPGATGSQYTTVLADDGSDITCVVTASTASGSTPISSNVIVVQTIGPTPNPLSNPAITGTLRVNQSLSVSDGTWNANDVVFTYQWFRNGALIPTVDTATYALTTADLGARIYARVIATTPSGAANASYAATVGPVLAALPPAPENTSLPAFIGTMEVGQGLTGDIGGWTNASSFTYRWLRDGTAIAGATATTYTLVSGDLNANIRFEVTATGTGGSTVAVSNPRGPVAQAPAGLVPVLQSAAVEPGIGKTAYDRQTVPAYSASNATQAINAAIALGIIASASDAVDYATGNGGGAFASIDAWLTACGQNKIGVIGSGNYSIPATRRYAPLGIFGYGATRPVITCASNGSAVFFVDVNDFTARYVRFEGFGTVFAAARDTTPGFTGGTAKFAPFHTGSEASYRWIMVGENATGITGSAAPQLRTTRCGRIRIAGQAGASITAVTIRERNTGMERDARGWVTARAYAVNDQATNGGGWYRCLDAHTSGVFATDLAADRWVLEFRYAGDWATGLNYKINDRAKQSNVWYRCLVAHTSGTFATDLAASRWIAEPGYSGEVQMSVVQELTANHVQKSLISSPVSWATSNTATAGALAVAINNGTGSHGYAALAVGDSVILTRATTRTFYKITTATTGNIVLSADNLMPGLNIADCWFQNCRNIYHGISDSAGSGNITFARNEMVGVEGVLCANTMQMGDMIADNNVWRDVTQAATNNWFQTFFKVSTNYPHHLGFRNHILRARNNDCTNITATGNKDGSNAAVFWDVRNALALVPGDVIASHNYFYRVRGTTGQEDGNVFYGKVVGGIVERNYIRECGAGFVSLTMANNGAETTGLVFKEPGNTAGYENAVFAVRGNTFEDMPPDICVVKLDNYNCTVEIDANTFIRCNISRAGSADAYGANFDPDLDDPTRRGIIRYTGLVRDLKIRGNEFIDCVMECAPPYANGGPYWIALHNTDPYNANTNITISDNVIRFVATAPLGANTEAIRLEDSSSTIGARWKTARNTIEGGFTMLINDAGSRNQTGPNNAPTYNYSPPTVGGGGLVPAITGTLTQGQTLTCSTGTWLNSPTGYAYQWQRDDSGTWTNIGTNANTFTLTASEVGKNVRCQVTASNANGSSVPATATAVGPIAASGGSYDADAQTWFARSSTQMTSTKKQAFSDFVAGLKTDGIWSKLDMLYWLFKTGVEEQTLYDIKRSGASASRNEWNGTAYVTGVGPTWADSTGWTGDGSNDLLRTGFNPGDGGGPYQIGGLSAAFGAYRISTGSSAAEFGVRRARIEGLTSGGARAARIFSGSSASQSGQSDGSGFYVGVRRAADQNTASEIRLFRNGSQIAQANPTDYTPGTEVENMEWWICATNADTNGNRTYATSNIGMVFAGDELTDTEITNFNSRVQTLISAL